MTKKVSLTNLSNVDTIRFKCNNCSAVVELPISPNSNLDCHCINCKREFNNKFIYAFTDMMKGLVRLKDLKVADSTDAQIELLTEIE